MLSINEKVYNQLALPKTTEKLDKSTFVLKRIITGL